MLILPELLRREIEERTRRAAPDEACGLLIGTRRGSEIEVCALAPATNVSIEPGSSFELDPLDVVAAEDSAASVRMEIVGTWHSHPRGPLDASSADRRGHGGWNLLIVGPAADASCGVQLRAYRATRDGLAPLEIARERAAAT